MAAPFTLTILCCIAGPIPLSRFRRFGSIFDGQSDRLPVAAVVRGSLALPALSIRPAVEADCATMLELIRELAGFERMLNQVAVDEARLRRDGFGPRPRFGCLLAERRGEVLGMALFFPAYSTFAGEAGLYIEDLIVRDAHRG